MNVHLMPKLHSFSVERLGGWSWRRHQMHYPFVQFLSSNAHQSTHCWSVKTLPLNHFPTHTSKERKHWHRDGEVEKFKQHNPSCTAWIFSLFRLDVTTFFFSTGVLENVLMDVFTPSGSAASCVKTLVLVLKVVLPMSFTCQFLLPARNCLGRAIHICASCDCTDRSD